MKDKNLLLTLPFIFFASYLFWGVPAYNSSIKVFPKDTLQVTKDSLVTIKLTFVGDLMCHSSQYKYVKDSKGTYNFTPVYEYVQPYLQKADLTIGNLETVLAGTTTAYSGYPAFNTPNAYADALKNIGFDYLFTANNHSYDQGEKGVIRTLSELSQRNLVSIGTHQNEKDRDSVRIANIKGVRIAFLGYTEFSNIPVPTAKEYLVNPIDTTLVRKNVTAARKQGADLVIVNYHWGQEYKQPTEFQKMIAEWTWNIGVDIIIGEHPHVLQPVQWFTKRSSARLDTGLVAYSLGNFYSSQQWRYSDAGVMLSIGIEKNLQTQRLRINEVSAVPTWVFKGTLQGEKLPKFLIFPSEMALQSKDSTLINKKPLPSVLKQLTKAQITKMEQAFEDSKKVLQNYGVNVKIDTY